MTLLTYDMSKLLIRLLFGFNIDVREALPLPTPPLNATICSTTAARSVPLHG